MKKMMIVVAVVAMSFAACGKKKDAAKPTTDMGSATAPAGSDAAGSGAAEGSAAPAPGM